MRLVCLLSQCLASGWFCALSVVPVCGQTIVYAHQVETFTNLDGRVFENVRLVRADAKGLIWSVTNGVSGGRIDLEDLSPSTKAQLGMTPEFLKAVTTAQASEAEQQAKEREAFRSAQVKAAKLAVSKKAKRDVDELFKMMSRAKVITKVQWSGGEVVATCDIGFALLKFDEKEGSCRVAALVALAGGASKVDVVVLVDAYSNKAIGEYTDRRGLKLK